MADTYVDLTGVEGMPRYSDGRLRCYPARRKLSKVRRVVLHQWAAHADLVLRPQETLEECAARRARSTVYTLDVFEGNVVVWAWDPAIVAWASNGWNRSSISIGVGAKLPKFERNRTTAHSPVAEFEAGLVRALQLVAEKFPGIAVVTHRQSSAGKAADPGEALARIAVREAPRLGLTIDFDTVMGTGLPCPREWRAPAATGSETA